MTSFVCRTSFIIVSMNSGKGPPRRNMSLQSALVMRHKRTDADRSDFFTYVS
jgi:hypothetical protein